MASDDIVVGLDIGTSKIATIIGNTWQSDPEKIEIVGVGKSPSDGLRKGVVVDIEKTTASIRESIKEAETMAGVQVGSVYAGIAGGHIMGHTSEGVVAVAGEGHEITKSDVDRAINTAKATATPVDREVIHVLPQDFSVDEQDGIKHPIGMSGIRLQANVHIITGAVASVQNLLKSVNNAGLSVEDIVLEPIASADSILSVDEKSVGVTLADMGGGTTDIVIYQEDALRHTKVISVGGDHVTNDIAQVLRMTPYDAEILKRRKGCALADLIESHEKIQPPTVSGMPATISSSGKMQRPRLIDRQHLAEIVQCRMEETLNIIHNEIASFKVSTPAGLVLTGGTSLIAGLMELAHERLPYPVRIGYPKPLKGLSAHVNSPIFATGVGLVMYGTRMRQSTEGVRQFMKPGDNLFDQILQRMKVWFSEYF